MAKYTSITASEAGKKSKRGPDKARLAVKNAIVEMSAEQIKTNLPIDLEKMNEKDRWSVIIGLMAYAFAKQQHVVNEESNPLTRIEIVDIKLK